MNKKKIAIYSFSFIIFFVFNFIFLTGSLAAAKKTGKLKVVLKDCEGFAINGTVTVKRGSVIKRRTTSGGMCSFKDLSLGYWTVSAKTFSGSLTGGPKEAVVLAGKEVTTTLLVSGKGGAIQFIRTGNLKVNLVDEDVKAVIGMVTATTIKKCTTLGGTCTLTGLLPGTWKVTAKPEGGAMTAARSVTVKSGQTANLLIKVKKEKSQKGFILSSKFKGTKFEAGGSTCKLKVNLVDENGFALKGAVTARKDKIIKRSTTNEGTCTFTGLPAGSWLVTAETQDRASLRTRSVTLKSGKIVIITIQECLPLVNIGQ